MASPRVESIAVINLTIVIIVILLSEHEMCHIKTTDHLVKVICLKKIWSPKLR